MENASKALLISGAILIAVVLIAFGLKIFNATSDSAEGETQTSEKIIESTNTASQSASSAISGLDQWIK